MGRETSSPLRLSMELALIILCNLWCLVTTLSLYLDRLIHMDWAQAISSFSSLTNLSLLVDTFNHSRIITSLSMLLLTLLCAQAMLVSTLLRSAMSRIM